MPQQPTPKPSGLLSYEPHGAGLLAVPALQFQKCSQPIQPLYGSVVTYETPGEAVSQLHQVRISERAVLFTGHHTQSVPCHCRTLPYSSVRSATSSRRLTRVSSCNSRLCRPLLINNVGFLSREENAVKILQLACIMAFFGRDWQSSCGDSTCWTTNHCNRAVRHGSPPSIQKRSDPWFCEFWLRL